MSALIDQTRGVGLDDETILVERAVAGDETAFRTLYHKFYNKVYAIARGILLDADEAEDATQEVFTLAYKNLHRFDRRSKFSTWLFRIAVNRSIQQGRKQKSRRLHVTLGEDAESIPETQEEFASPIQEAVDKAMSQLQAPDRAVLTLFYWDDLSLQEIGESLGCTANAAKTRLFRARERFKDSYEEVSS